MRFSTETKVALPRADTQVSTAATDDMFFGPPPPKQSNDAIMKRFTGPGFPRIPVSLSCSRAHSRRTSHFHRTSNEQELVELIIASRR